MIFRAVVREAHRRVVYVEADSVSEARRAAKDPSNWWDSEDPDTAANVSVYTNTVTKVVFSVPADLKANEDRESIAARDPA